MFIKSHNQDTAGISQNAAPWVILSRGIPIKADFSKKAHLNSSVFSVFFLILFGAFLAVREMLGRVGLRPHGGC